MNQFSDADLERARTRWDVIAADVPMKRKGRELAGCCPFHAEKTPSFYINPDKGFFHCFGCGAHGTAIDYLMRVRGVDFVGAVKDLLGLPQQRPKEAAPVDRRQQPEREHHRENELNEILRGAGPITDRTAAHLYLWTRGTRHPGRFDLLAHPAVYCHEVRKPLPAIIAPITSSEDQVTAIQRIWLADTWIAGEAPDSRAPLKTRKKTLGDMRDGACRLKPADRRLGLAEGVETAAAAIELFRRPVWAACGVGRLGFPAHWRQVGTPPGQVVNLWIPPERPPRDVETRFVEERPPSIWIPSCVENLVVYGDNGWIGRVVSAFAAGYWRKQGLDASAAFPPERFDDFNTQLLAEAA